MYSFSLKSVFVCSKLSGCILIIPQPPQTYSGNTKRFDLKGAIFLPFEIKTFMSFFIFSLADYSQWLAGQLRGQIKWMHKKTLLIFSLLLSLQLRSTVFYQAQWELAHKSTERHPYKTVLMLFLVHSNQYMWLWTVLPTPETREWRLELVIASGMGGLQQPTDGELEQIVESSGGASRVIFCWYKRTADNATKNEAE